MTIPSMIVSMLLTFTFSFDEFIIAYFLTQFELTLPIKIWANLITGYDPTVNAHRTIVFFLSLMIVFFGQRFVRKNRIEAASALRTARDQIVNSLTGETWGL